MKCPIPTEAQDDDMALTKFVYRVTRHVGRLVTKDVPLHTSLLTQRSRDELKIDLETTIDCLNDAMRRERVLDFTDAGANNYYAGLLDFIGLTKWALYYYEQALKLGFADVDKGKVERIRKQMRDMNKGQEGTSKVSMDVIQIPNLNMQYGNEPSDMEYIIKEYASEFYKDFVENDDVFVKPASQLKRGDSSIPEGESA